MRRLFASFRAYTCVVRGWVYGGRMETNKGKALARIARSADPGYLERLWVEANGDWMTPREDDIRAFLSALSRATDM